MILYEITVARNLRLRAEFLDHRSVHPVNIFFGSEEKIFAVGGDIRHGAVFNAGIEEPGFAPLTVNQFECNKQAGGFGKSAADRGEN